MNLVWSTRAYHYDKVASTDQTISDVESILKRDGHVQAGDIIVILASMPIQDKGRTNMIKVHMVK
jgi:pyruvate kinase